MNPRIYTSCCTNYLTTTTLKLFDVDPSEMAGFLLERKGMNRKDITNKIIRIREFLKESVYGEVYYNIDLPSLKTTFFIKRNELNFSYTLNYEELYSFNERSIVEIILDNYKDEIYKYFFHLVVDIYSLIWYYNYRNKQQSNHERK